MKQNYRNYLLATLLLGGMSASAWAASWSYPTTTPTAPFAGGTGTADAPYQVSDAQQLANLAYLVNQGINQDFAYYCLTADIDVSGESWTPIGNTSEHPFSGYFEGNGHAVKGLSIGRKNSEHAEGLFGYVAGEGMRSARLTNVKVTEGLIIGNAEVGAIVGKATSTIIVACNNEGCTVEGSDYVGGIAGYYDNANNAMVSFAACNNAGSVSGEKYVGGLCGYLASTSYLSAGCFNRGTVKGTGYVDGVYPYGALAGYMVQSHAMTDCYYLDSSCDKAVGNQGASASVAVTASQCASGQATSWLTEASKSAGPVWFQTIGQDAYPVHYGRSITTAAQDLVAGGDVVYCTYKHGTTEPTYSNTNEGGHPDTNNHNDAVSVVFSWTGFTECSATATCSVCGETRTGAATITSKSTESGTCSALEYTATVTLFGQEYTNSKMDATSSHDIYYVDNGDVSHSAKCRRCGMVLFTEEHHTTKGVCAEGCGLDLSDCEEINSSYKYKDGTLIVYAGKFDPTSTLNINKSLIERLIIEEDVTVGKKDFGSYTKIKHFGFNGNAIINENGTTYPIAYFFRDLNTPSLVSLLIGKNVKGYQFDYFAGCKNIKTLIYNSTDWYSSTSGRFKNFTNLSSVILGENAQMSFQDFQNCTNLSSITINGDLNGSHAIFDGCTNISCVKIGDKATEISEPFYNCTKLTNLSIGNSVVSIVNDAFQGCTGLETVELPNSLTSIGSGVFQGCTGLETVELPNGLKIIYSNTFSGCSNLTTINIPDGVTSIGSSAFKNCSNLTTINIPDGVTSIGSSAFKNCSKLTTINIPDGVTNIGDEVFSGCSNLATINIPDGVTSIGSSAFYGCSNLATINIPDGVTSIGSSAFYGCSELTSIYIPNGVTSIGDEVFSGCSNLATITIPNGVRSIGSSAFSRCSNLATITIPNGVTSIGSSAFSGCSELTSINIPNGVTSIGSYTFSGCSNLTTITIPDGVTSIGSSAFSACSELTSINIPNGVTSIGSYTFSGCSNLASVTIPNSVNIIDNGAFRGCSAIKSVIFEDGENEVSIGYGSGASRSLFDESPLESVYVGRTMVPIAATNYFSYPFYNIKTITEATVSGDETSLASKFFYGCDNLKNVYLNQKAGSIGESAFYRTATPNVTIFHVDSQTPLALTGDNVFNNDFRATYIVVPHDSYDAYLTDWSTYETCIIQGVEKDKEIVELTALPTTSSLLEARSEVLSTLIRLKIKGTINAHDLMILRDKTPRLISLDLSEASIVANDPTFEYWSGCYMTSNNTLPLHAFDGKTSLQELILPDNLEAIGDYALQNCSSLESIAGKGVKTIGQYGCYKDVALKEVNLPNLESLPSAVFSGCNSLKKLSLPSVNTINEMAFPKNVEIIELESLETLRGLSFKDLDYLKTVYLPNVSKIENFGYASAVIENCSRLTDVTLGKLEEFDSPMVIFRNVGTTGEGLHLHVPMATSSAPLTKIFAGTNAIHSIDMDAVTSLPENWAKNITTLKEVHAPNLTHIGASAFSGCSGLTTLECAEIEELGTEAFYKCSSMTSFRLNNSLTNIPNYAFYGCKALTSINIPNSLVNIGSYAFSGCTNLPDFKLPATMETIGNNAFANCTSLTSLHVPSSLRSIGSGAFTGCSSIKSVYAYTIEPISINSTTFDHVELCDLYVPHQSFSNYYFDPGWSKFLKLNEFDEPYEYFYLTKDYYVSDATGVLDGNPDALFENNSGYVLNNTKEVQHLHQITIQHDGSDGASLRHSGKNLHADKLTFEIDIVKGRWYFFSFPFDIPRNCIKAPGRHVFRCYDGAKRAESGATGWSNMSNETPLKLGQGYIFQCEESGKLVIDLDNPAFVKETDELDPAFTMGSYVAKNAQDGNWNLMGNPLIGYHDIQDLAFNAPVTVFNAATQMYEAYSASDDDYVLHPFQAFFVQKPEKQDKIVFQNKNLLTYYEQQARALVHANRRAAQRVNPERLVVNLSLSADEVADRTRIVFNDNRSEAYEQDCDAAKFFSSEAVPQLYTIDMNMAKYAINERPQTGDVNLGFVAPSAGEYTLAAGRSDVSVKLHDNYLDKDFVLSSGDSYTFWSEDGTFDDRFSMARGYTDAEGLEQLSRECGVEVEPTMGGLVFRHVGDAEVYIFNVAGALVEHVTTDGEIQLAAGIYVVTVNGQSQKFTIK